MERWLICFVIVLTLNVDQAMTIGGSCHNNSNERYLGCENGYYCCNIYSGACCPQLRNNEFYDWILIFSSAAVLVFISVMSCYWCSCCPMYNRRSNPQTTGNAAVNPPGQGPTPPSHEECRQGAPYLIQPVPCCERLPPYSQQPPGLPQQHTNHTLVPPYTPQHLPQPTQPCGEAPPYSRYPVPNPRTSSSTPPYQILQPSRDQYIPLAPPVYPDEPPPRYTP